MHLKLWFVLCLSVGLSVFPPSLFAQAASPATTPPSSVNKKNVVKNFKINLSEYSSFGSDCSKKPLGDSNCDGKIDQFDLSIWEVEFNSKQSPKRSDFNADGAVTLLDYGIWRNTTFPQKASLSQTAPKVNLITSLFNKLIGWVPNLNFSTPTAFAQTSSKLDSHLYGLFSSTDRAQYAAQDPLVSLSNGQVIVVIEVSDSSYQLPTQFGTGGQVSGNLGIMGATVNIDSLLEIVKDSRVSFIRPPFNSTNNPVRTITEELETSPPVSEQANAPTPAVIASTDTGQPTIIQSSNTFVSGAGNSMVINRLTDGNTQQVNFTPSGNPQSASFFNTNGASYAEVAFTQSGGTVISTEQSGIPVTINKTAAGPIIENFRNPDGSPLAIKSWPTQTSYDAGQPPVAVTIPGIGSTKEVLNLQPNGDGIVEKLDAAGNVLTRTQLRSNGTTVTEDFQNKTLTQSNSQIGFTTLSMKNNLGGDTQYMFYKGTLYTVVQSDNKKNSYISKPLDESGNTWNFQTLEGGVPRSEKTVTNPISELKSNTPDPKTLIQYINYYKQAPSNPNAVNFSDGFTSTAPGIANPVAKANAILTISHTQPPAVLGIIKEAFAATWTETPKGTEAPGEQTFTGPNGLEAVTFTGGSEGNGRSEVQVSFYSGGSQIGSTTFEGDRQNLSTNGVNPGYSGTPGVGTSETGSMTEAGLSSLLNGTSGGTITSGSIPEGADSSASGPTAPAPEAAAPAAAPAAQAQPAAAPGAPFGEAPFQQGGAPYSPSAAAASVATTPTREGDSWKMGTSDATVISVNGTLVTVDVYDPDTQKSSTLSYDTASAVSTFRDDERGTFTANSGTLTAITSDVSAEGSIIGFSAYDHTSVVAVGDASYINAEGYIEGGRPATQDEVQAFQQQQAEQAEFNPDAIQTTASFDDSSSENWSNDTGYVGNSIDEAQNLGGEQVGSAPNSGTDETPSSDTTSNPQIDAGGNFQGEQTNNGNQSDSSGSDGF